MTNAVTRLVRPLTKQEITDVTKFKVVMHHAWNILPFHSFSHPPKSYIFWPISPVRPLIFFLCSFIQNLFMEAVLKRWTYFDGITKPSLSVCCYWAGHDPQTKSVGSVCNQGPTATLKTSILFCMAGVATQVDCSKTPIPPIQPG